MNSKLALEFYQPLKEDTITHGKGIHATRAWQQACKSYELFPRKVQVNIYRGVADEKKIIYACSLLLPNACHVSRAIYFVGATPTTNQEIDHGFLHDLQIPRIAAQAGEAPPRGS